MTPAASPTTGQASPLKVSTQARPGSRVALEVAIPGGRCQASYDAALAKLSRSLKLPGFRKGKVPQSVVIQQLGTLRIRATALEDLVENVCRDALQQERIEALGRPELKEGFEVLLERFTPGAELVLTLEMDVEPTPTLKTTKGLKAEAIPVPFNPARVDEVLEETRRRLAALVPVEDRPAALGDVARIRFSGVFADTGDTIDGGSSEGMDLEMEEERMIPGFVAGIVGMDIGGTRDVTCTFPASYPQEEAAGRPATFSITLLDLKTRDLPELDDAFAQQASDKATLAELRAQLEERLKEDAELRGRTNRWEALQEALVAELEVELPETLVLQEMRHLVERTGSQLAQQGMDVKAVFTPDVVRSLMDTSRPEAEKRLRRVMALRALASAEQIEVSQEEILARTAEVRRTRNSATDTDEERLRLAVADELLREKLMNWLEANATISEAAAPAREASAEEEQKKDGGEEEEKQATD
jgi:trigger factor